MNFHKIFSAVLISAGLVMMSGAAFAKGPDQVQQHPPKMEQQAPVKPGYKQAAPKKQKTHFIRIKRGDTLGKIAHKYHTSVAHLKRLNHLRSDKIFAGQRLRVR